MSHGTAIVATGRMNSRSYVGGVRFAAVDALSGVTDPPRKVPTMMLDITRGKHMLLTTFRRSGVSVSTPVWTVPVSDGRVGMWTAAGTGKYKRLRNNPHLSIQACTARGKTKPRAPILEGIAEIVQAGPLFDEVQAKIRAKYGWQIPIVKRISRLQGRFKPGQSFGDTVVLITVTGPADGDASPSSPPSS